MQVKVIIEHNSHLYSKESYRAIPEDPDKWDEHREFSQRLEELMEQHDEVIDDFEVIGFKDGSEERYSPEDLENTLN